MARPTTNDEQVAERLIDAAVELLGNVAPDELSVRLVAQKAGSSPAAIYILFGDRGQLLAATAKVISASLYDALAAQPTTADALADLRSLGLAYLAWADEHPHLYALLFTEAAARRPASTTQPGNPALPLVTAIDRAIEAGVMSGEPTVIAATVMAGLHGLALFSVHRVMDPATIQSARPALVDALLRGWSVGR